MIQKLLVITLMMAIISEPGKEMFLLVIRVGGLLKALVAAEHDLNKHSQSH